ncbi:MAG: ABC transporter ATP-binding protein [Myxococcales bacterium]|nr:ABC transporter ATP-binding protein [Myxococcales bacterium]
MKATGLVRRFGGLTAVDGVSLQVPPGELYGLVGPDGAGKTTTVRMLAGLLTPDAGVVELDRSALGYMPQRYSLYGDLSIAENLAFFGRLFGLSKAQRAERTARLLEITRLGRFQDRRADALSGGMYKKLALACALLPRPQVLLLDEPSNGVDPVSRRELWDLLYEFVAEGMAVVLCTPYMDEAARCHRVGLLDRGRLLAEGAPAELVARFRHPTLRLTTPDRDAAERTLAEDPAVLAVSPEGDTLRLVVRAQAAAALAPRLAALGTTEPVAPDFEDVFLALLQDPESVRAAA